jgi:hypothetical protein
MNVVSQARCRGEAKSFGRSSMAQYTHYGGKPQARVAGFLFDAPDTAH